MLPNLNPIPDWDISGVLPASYEGEPASPYEVSLLDIVGHFSLSDARRRLLTGLLNFRAELHSAGLEQGFQWIDGSFVEHIEEIDDRPPRDIDVVTFFHIPDNHTEITLLQGFPDIFNRQGIKDTYNVDSYYVPVNQTTPENLIDWSVYWNSLWGHRKGDFLWKGYLQIDLASGEDIEARTELERFDEMSGSQ